MRKLDLNHGTRCHRLFRVKCEDEASQVFARGGVREIARDPPGAKLHFAALVRAGDRYERRIANGLEVSRTIGSKGEEEDPPRV